MREGTRTGQVQTRLVTAPAEFPRPPVDLHTVIDGPSGGTDGPTGVLGEEYLEEELSGLRFRISHPAFFQTNTEMAETLYGIAGDYAGLTGAEKRLGPLLRHRHDRPLARRSRAARSGASSPCPRPSPTPSETRCETGSTTRTFVAADARLGITPARSSGPASPTCVIVDPPRAGLSKKIVRRLIEAEAPRIVYVSCNPTTLAPNAAQLVEAGYELKRIRPVDMFPQTPHVECVALLERPAVRFRAWRSAHEDSGSPPGSTPRSQRRSPLAARSSATARSGRTTRRWPSGLETLAAFAEGHG